MNGIVKFFLILIVWFGVLIPLDLFLAARYFFEPSGFWQNLVVFGLGVWILGGFQLVFFVVGVFASIAIVAAD